MDKKRIYGIIALLPLLFSAYFVIFSEKEIYDKFASLPVVNSFLTKTDNATSTATTSSLHFANSPFRLGLDLSSGVRLTYLADVSKIESKDKDESLSILRDVIERRVNVFGVAEPLVQIESSSISNENRLLVELPGLTNIDQAIKLIGETPTLEFKLIQTATNSTTTLESIGLDGRYLKRAQVVFDPQLNSPQVSIEWNDVGTAIFASTTKNNLGKPLAIILDGVPVSAPIIQSEISDGKAVISGNFDREEARILAGRLNTGALPVAIKVIGSEVIQPTLGAKALNAGILATFYGFLAIALMMIVWYRIPGIVGVVSLLSYVFLVLSIFKFIPVTISAAAIAGFIISIGLAVDGNILIFERLKEELQKGKNLTDGVEEAFGRAWTSIRDSNLASLIAAIVLFYIGTSVVKGFALTLMIGVLTSMFTNVFITRYLLRSVLPNTNSSKIKNWFKSPF